MASAKGKEIVKAGSSAIVQADPAAMRAVRSSMISMPIGDRIYPVHHVRQCKVCNHPGRAHIEERILNNHDFTSIAQWVSGQYAERFDGIEVRWPEITSRNISRHFNRGHSPVDARVLHELQEQAAGTELDYENLKTRVIDELVFADLVLARVRERAVRGEIEPGYKEGLAAAKLKADAKRAAQSAETEDRAWFYEGAFERYFQHAKAIMDTKQWERFSLALMQDPILRQLTERAQNPNVVDAELVEEPPK